MAIKLTVMPLDMDPNSKPIIKIFNKEELTLGRLPSNDVVLNRPEVSGIHARLRVEHDEFGEVSKLFITDLGSSNGTLVEKNPLKPRVEVPMMPSERIFIGSYVIKPTSVDEAEVGESKPVAPSAKHSDHDFDFAAKTQSFDNVLFKAVEEESVEDEQDEYEAQEERVVANSSQKNPFSSIMFGDEPAPKAAEEKDSSVLRSMYASPTFDAGHREPEARLSPFGKTYVEEDEEEEVAPLFNKSDENKTQDLKAPTTQRTVEARPTWAQVKEDYLEDKELEEKEEPKKYAVDEDGFPIYPDEDEEDETPVVDFSPPMAAKIEMPEPVKEPVSAPVVHEAPQVSPKVSPSVSVAQAASVATSTDVKPVEKFSIRVTVGEQSEHEFKIQAKAFTSIKGVVMHKGKPLAGVTVKSSALGHTTTDNAGRYEFSRVLEDTPYSLSFNKDQFVVEPSSINGSASVHASEIVANAIKLYSIKGVISHNGRPLDGVLVDAGELGKKVTGPDGVYQFDNVPEGKEYDLVLSKEGYAFQS